MQVKPKIHEAVDPQQVNTLLVIARQSGCDTPALASYFDWQWQTLCVSVARASGDSLLRIQGQMQLIQLQYELLFGDIEKMRQQQDTSTRSKPKA
jgi:hypothetical protein